MKLRQLKAVFLKIINSHEFLRVDDFQSAQGLMFLCPKCYVTNGNTSRGTHSIICWFADKGVPVDLHPLPGRWIPSGTGLDDLSFIGPNAASILLTTGCQWHGFIKNGEAE